MIYSIKGYIIQIVVNEFKAKVVLEVLEKEQTINEIASKYELLPANVKNWKKMFLENQKFRFFALAI